MIDLIIIRFFFVTLAFLHNDKINYVSIFFVFILKIHERTSLYMYEQFVIVIARCRVKYNINVCREHYKHFE